MKFVLIVSFLLQSCASSAMGRKCPCEDVRLPVVPLVENCIAHGDGTCVRCDQAGCVRVPDQNKVCRPADQDAALFNWIEFVKSAVNQ